MPCRLHSIQRDDHGRECRSPVSAAIVFYFAHIQDENLEAIATGIQDPQFGILTVDAFDDQHEPIIPAHQEYSHKLWFRIKRR